jgi:hypothetical protein
MCKPRDYDVTEQFKSFQVFKRDLHSKEMDKLQLTEPYSMVSILQGGYLAEHFGAFYCKHFCGRAI